MKKRANAMTEFAQALGTFTLGWQDKDKWPVIKVEVLMTTICAVNYIFLFSLLNLKMPQVGLLLCYVALS